MQVPGRSGFSLLGDESIEFARTPRDYVEKRRENYGDVFLGRVLNKPTVFFTSNSAVQDLLKEKWSCFAMGYREYMFQLFDENLVFMEGDAWQDMRKLLERVLSRESVEKSMKQTAPIIEDHFSHLTTRPASLRTRPLYAGSDSKTIDQLGFYIKPVVIYEMFKTLATRLSIALFLSHDLGEEDASEISELMTTHWRGIISVPLSMRVPWYGWKSGYSKALAAKERLFEIIAAKLKSNPSNIASCVHEQCSDEDLAAHHLLLFISALIPKAMSSLLTSVVIELSKTEKRRWCECCHDDSLLEDMLLEVQRLWPPFFGGRRISTQPCEVGGYHIAKGHSVAYISRTANRDERVFPGPNCFKPERWKNENAGDRDKVWTFGGGPRQCIGKHLSNTLLKECVKELMRCYTWELIPGQDLTYKTLPVSRPKNDIQAVFTKLTATT